MAAPRARRLLGSSLVDLLVGPHGIDRYLELIRPSLTLTDARAEVLSVHRQTDRSVTLTLRPNAAFSGFQAGQFVRMGIEIDGVRRTRTYSPASSEHASDGRLELTATLRDGGLVSPHLRNRIAPGTIVHLSVASGDFVLPPNRPQRLALISGGSGITPVLSMLRTLIDEGHNGEIIFIHYARTAADWLYRPALEALSAAHPQLTVAFVATREGGAHLAPDSLPAQLPDGFAQSSYAAVCGPPALLEATASVWPAARVIAETFTPPTLLLTGDAATGHVHFRTTGRQAEIQAGTLLEQAEAAGLTPEFGCRMGICHTCTCRKTAGTVKNILTGEVSSEEDEDIQLCISVPAGDVALEL